MLRYKSYYIVSESYLFTLYKYIEQNPIQAKISEHIGQYKFTLLATLLQNNLTVIECAKHSQLIELLKDGYTQASIAKLTSKCNYNIITQRS